MRTVPTVLQIPLMIGAFTIGEVPNRWGQRLTVTATATMTGTRHSFASYAEQW